ncbi:MAG: WYL domain-containing protein [Acidimicrobiaceae bacterium]|jgi:proteasome accessory factor B|nr:WYL domain-containing protein [Acidimicrobiaceae bacterium]
MSKLERLLNLTAALLDTEMPLTAEKIWDRVGGYPDTKASFRRAFERDKDELRAMGIPIAVAAVPGTDPPIDGYVINRADYAGDELRFEPDELAALHLATNLVRLDGNDTGLMKLGGAAETGPDGITIADEVGRVPFDDALATLISAAADRKAVAFRYADTDRVVEPWRLSFSRGHWYLNGWDRVRGAERLYRFDRLQGPVQVAGAAEEPVGAVSDPLDLRGWELGDGEPTAARVFIDADQASWARHILGDVDDVDGGVVATLQVRNIEAFRSFVLSFLDHAEVLEPAEFRDDMVAWLRAMQ